MQYGIYNYYKFYNKNNMIFDKDSYGIGENLEYPFVLIREKLAKMNISIDTLDIYPIEKYDKVIFLDMPRINDNIFKTLINLKKDLYLVIFESEIIKPDNWNKKNHKYFKKVFTWNDDIIDNKKYFKIFWPNKYPESLNFVNYENKKLCTLIAGNKSNNDKRELYSERLNAINWFEENHSNDFDFFGIGWDKYNFKGRFTSKLNRLNSIRKIFKHKYTTYKGCISSKNLTLRNYKFCICYENAKEIKGYITEKIFDCFFSGCVPIYLGAPNIMDFIPKETFIRRDDFDDYEKLYNHLVMMTEEEYNGYMKSIENFIYGDLGCKFNAECFANTIIKQISNI